MHCVSLHTPAKQARLAKGKVRSTLLLSFPRLGCAPLQAAGAGLAGGVLTLTLLSQDQPAGLLDATGVALGSMRLWKGECLQRGVRGTGSTWAIARPGCTGDSGPSHTGCLSQLCMAQCRVTAFTCAYGPQASAFQGLMLSTLCCGPAPKACLRLCSYMFLFCAGRRVPAQVTPYGE